ncbi:unnamed protein product, partial [Mesorhabditis spiculigera]
MKIRRIWRRRNERIEASSAARRERHSLPRIGQSIPKPLETILEAESFESEFVATTMTVEQKTKLSYKKEEVIRLNVGGQRFDTFLRTLLVDRNNELFSHFVVLLETDLTDDRLPARDNEGAFFLDRDPDHFRTILNNLRYVSHLQQKQRLTPGNPPNPLSLDEEGKPQKSGGLFGRFRKAT